MEETTGSRGLDSTHSCKKLDMLTFNFNPKCPANLAKMENMYHTHTHTHTYHIEKYIHKPHNIHSNHTHTHTLNNS